MPPISPERFKSPLAPTPGVLPEALVAVRCVPKDVVPELAGAIVTVSVEPSDPALMILNEYPPEPPPLPVTLSPEEDAFPPAAPPPTTSTTTYFSPVGLVHVPDAVKTVIVGVVVKLLSSSPVASVLIILLASLTPVEALTPALVSFAGFTNNLEQSSDV